MNTEPSNDDRADWAQQALNKFAEVTRMDTAGEDTETILGDLLCNLMHLAKREEIDIEAKWLGASVNFEAEVLEERSL